MTAWRYAPVGIWLAGLIGCVIVILHTAFTVDLSAFLPRSPSPSEAALVEQLRDGAVSRIILLGIEGAPEPTLTALSRNLAKRLRGEPGFLSVNNGEDPRLAEDQAFLWNNRYLLSSAITQEHFSEKELREALQSDVDLLSSGAAVIAKQYLPADPTGEMLRVLDEVLPAAPPSTKDGVWVSGDGGSALMVVQTKAAMSDLDAQDAGLKRIDSAFAAAQNETVGAAGAHLTKTGSGVFSVATRDRIKRDAVRFSALATIIIMGILVFVYRSARVFFFGLLPVISGVIAGVAAVSLGFGYVHGITMGFGVTLIGEAVDYPIYLFTQTRSGTQLQLTLQRIWPTLRLGVLTSVFGFSTMLFSSFNGIAQLGTFSIVGLITAVLVTRNIVPVLLPVPFELQRPVAIGTVLHGIMQTAPRLRLLLFVLLAGAVLVLALQHQNVWDDELASLSPILAGDKDADRKLRSQLGAPDVGYLLIVSGTNQENTLQKSERIATALQRMVEQRVLAGFQNPAALLPSKGAQQTRQNAIPARAELTARFEQALRNMPFRPEIFAPFRQDVDAAKTRALIDRHSLDNTSFGVLVDTLLVQRGAGWQAFFPLRGVSNPGRMADEISRVAIPGVLFLDIKGDSTALYRAYRRQAMFLSFGGAVAILLLLAVSLRRLRRVTNVVLPLAAAVLVTAAILVSSGQRLTIFHLIGLLLVVAIGSNYSLFFEHTDDGPEARDLVIASLAVANFCTIIGFGVLSFSEIPVLHGIGLTVAAGAALSLIFCAILSERVIGECAHGYE